MIVAILALVQQSQTSLLDHALAQWKTTPEMRIEDAYKWLYHATLGGEHAVTSADGPRTWLEREWPTVGDPLKDEPEVVPLTPDGRLVRVHLRPYKKRNGDQEMLLWAFVFSAERFKRSKAEFLTVWQEFEARLRASSWNELSHREWSRLDRETRVDGYRAIHHSKAYEEAYKPAYRVIKSEFWTSS